MSLDYQITAEGPEATNVLIAACKKERIDNIKQAMANKIVPLAKADERSPDALCEQVLKDIRRANLGGASWMWTVHADKKERQNKLLEGS